MIKRFRTHAVPLCSDLISMPLKPITQAIEDIREGKVVLLADDECRENEGDFVFAAEKCTPELVNLMMREGRGLICMPMTREDTRRLRLPQQVEDNQAHLATAFTVSIDAAKGITTGISASDRSHTILTACNPDCSATDLVRPGHIFPLEAQDGGVLFRPGHTEAAVDLARLAGLGAMGVICEILDDDGEPCRFPQLLEISDRLDLGLYTIRDLVEYRLQREPFVRKLESIRLPTAYGDFHLHVYRSGMNEGDDIHLALTCGCEHFDPNDTPLVRVHAEWSIGNIVRRLMMPDGSPLNHAMKRISREDKGALVFLRHTPDFHEIPSYLADSRLPHDIWTESNGEVKTLRDQDSYRGHGLGAQILKDLGIQKMRLLSNSDSTYHGIGHFGLEIVERIPLEPDA